MALDAGRDVGGPAVVQSTVSRVDDGKTLSRIEPPRPRWSPGKLRRGGPDRTWPETCTRTVGGREIERDSGDRDVGVREIARIGSAQEAERPRVGGLVAKAVGCRCRERVVPGAFHGHVASPRPRSMPAAQCDCADAGFQGGPDPGRAGPGAHGAAQIVRVMPRRRPSSLTSFTNDLTVAPSRDRTAVKSFSRTRSPKNRHASSGSH